MLESANSHAFHKEIHKGDSIGLKTDSGSMDAQLCQSTPCIHAQLDLEQASDGRLVDAVIQDKL